MTGSLPVRVVPAPAAVAFALALAFAFALALALALPPLTRLVRPLRRHLRTKMG